MQFKLSSLITGLACLAATLPLSCANPIPVEESAPNSIEARQTVCRSGFCVPFFTREPPWNEFTLYIPPGRVGTTSSAHNSANSGGRDPTLVAEVWNRDDGGAFLYLLLGNAFNVHTSQYLEVSVLHESTEVHLQFTRLDMTHTTSIQTLSRDIVVPWRAASKEVGRAVKLTVRWRIRDD